MSIVVLVIPYLLSAVAAYLIGSLSFSIIFTKLFDHKDVRDFGSGNAGATNVLRTSGKLPAIFTFLLDFLKSVAAICAAWAIFRYFSSAPDGKSLLTYLFTVNDPEISHYLLKYIAGFMCVLGHIFPVYFDFRGGKGVLASAGLVLMIDWRIFLIGVTCFAVVLAVTRIVSLGSIVALVSVPVSTAVIQIALRNPAGIVVEIFSVLLAALVIFMHRSNIRRLLNGTEPKFGGKAKQE